MARSDIATDSASTLRDLTGDDATATFESDPKFVDSDPTATASSENVEVQRDTDDTEDSDEEEEDAADLEDEGVDEDDVDEEDEDDDSDEEDTEDDADEVATSNILRVDGLLGQEDELADAAKDRDRKHGDAERAQKQAKVDDGDDDAGDVAQGIDEDNLDEDDLDTDQVATPQVGARNAAGPAEMRA